MNLQWVPAGVATAVVTASVGKILLQGSESWEMGELRATLSNWLQHTGWAKSVELAVVAAPGLGAYEVAFLPGEFQSNGAWKLRYEKAPNPKEVARLLERWLETRADAP